MIISHIRFIIEFSSPGSGYHMTQTPPMIGQRQQLRMVVWLLDCLLQPELLVVVVGVTLGMTSFGRP